MVKKEKTARISKIKPLQVSAYGLRVEKLISPIFHKKLKEEFSDFNVRIKNIDIVLVSKKEEHIKINASNQEKNKIKVKIPPKINHLSVIHIGESDYQDKKIIIDADDSKQLKILINLLKGL